MSTSTSLPDQLAKLTPGTWTVDASHSNVGFTVRHLMVSKVRGNFGTFYGVVTIAENPLESTVEATVDTTSITTNDEGRDQHLRSADFFEVEQLPDDDAAQHRRRAAWHVTSSSTPTSRSAASPARSSSTSSSTASRRIRGAAPAPASPATHRDQPQGLRPRVERSARDGRRRRRRQGQDPARGRAHQGLRPGRRRSGRSELTAMGVHRLNHAVLYVRDARTAAEFYRNALDFESVADMRWARHLHAGPAVRQRPRPRSVLGR